MRSSPGAGASSRFRVDAAGPGPGHRRSRWCGFSPVDQKGVREGGTGTFSLHRVLLPAKAGLLDEVDATTHHGANGCPLYDGALNFSVEMSAS